MANIPIPENDDSLELNVRYQPDMVLEGMLDATVPEMKYLRLSQGNETHDLLGAQSGDQVLELLSEDLTAAEEGKVLTVVEDNTGDTPVYNAEWADAPSGLPEITNADEGKVLTVVDNSGTLEAEWAEPSGGGDSYHVSIIADNQGGYTLDSPDYQTLYDHIYGAEDKCVVIVDFSGAFSYTFSASATIDTDENLNPKGINLDTYPLMWELDDTVVKAVYNHLYIDNTTHDVTWPTEETLRITLDT